jgi:hypothetical protein
LCNFNRVIGTSENLPRLHQECPSGRSEHRLSWCAYEQSYVHLLFKIRKLFADRRLRHVKNPRGAAETSLVRRGKIAKMPQFHELKLSVLAMEINGKNRAT